ncbi:hypothetical protein [Maribacter hydrothermalis]|uniref:Uncharacterized protein n=1 Tax=Maribacter hydrothermalis TaxID=1836467 RepID=A0A1B7ZD36_9FLAO|nr:hypothetical protein [Maribacter hydrothermalis]APQ18784.1 hypothetical protein BTR34_16320 [Maribacter hydrothermalis]OBR41028.1 hypothetical protein A9200_14495 [Maribacter hydrothermalis]
MERLNYFNPYSSKQDHHEDRLTRSFLVLLKYSPACFSFFYESILLENKTLPLLSSQINEDIQFKTQVGSILFETELLLSILITNDTLLPTRKIEAVERNAVYDGVITVGNKVSMIIENKPEKNNVWEDQLCPSEKHLSEDIKIIETAVVITWSSIIKWLNEFVNSNMFNYTERQVANDFLSLIQSNFSYLNPFDRYAHCKGNTSLILKRTENLLKSIVNDESLVRHHLGWGYFIETLSFGSIRKIGLIYKPENKVLELSLLFGDTQGQAKAYYPTNVNIKDFKEKKWIVYGNFHLATVASNLVYFYPKGVDLEKYLTYWNNHGMHLRQVRGHENLTSYLDTLFQDGIIPRNDNQLEDKILKTNIVNVNICPGIGFIYQYPLDKIEALDIDTNLQEDLISKIKYCIKENINESCNFLKNNN